MAKIKVACFFWDTVYNGRHQKITIPSSIRTHKLNLRHNSQDTLMANFEI